MKKSETTDAVMIKITNRVYEYQGDTYTSKFENVNKIHKSVIYIYTIHVHIYQFLKLSKYIKENVFLG